MEEEEGASFSHYEYWSKEKLDILINLYYEERDLWDTTRSPTFDQRQEAFERIANALSCEVFDVNRKVRHLRTYYAKLLRDSAQNKLRRGKQWQFFDQLQFLHDHIVTRMTKPGRMIRPVSKNPKDLSLARVKVEEAKHEINTSIADCPFNLSPQLQVLQDHYHGTGPESVEQADASNAQDDSKMDNGMSASPGMEMSESSTDSSMIDPQKHSSSSRLKRIKIRTAKRLKHSPRSATNYSAGGSGNGTADDMDADEIFGRHVANELKLISGMREKQFAKLQINNILFNAQFGLVKLPEHILQSLAEMDQQQAEMDQQQQSLDETP